MAQLPSTTRRVRESGSPDYYTIAEVQAILRYSRATVYRLLKRGELPSRGTGKLRRIPRWAVEMQREG